MDVRIGGASFVLALFAGLLLLFVVSRRVPSLALFLLCGALGAAGLAGFLLVGNPEEAYPATVVATLVLGVGGLFGAVLTGIDCVREEAWRRAPAQPAVRPDDEVIRSLIRRVREGDGAPMGDCPHCGTHVCFRADLGCPACGRRIDQEA
jgi:hypothetical protein